MIKPLTRRARLKEIIQVFRQYKVIQNFSQQKDPIAVRTAFETLGPTFIKIGQMLSVRSDLLQPNYLTAFQGLQDNVKSDPFTEVKSLLEKEWQRPLSAIFQEFEETAFASASIGQAHRATLLDGSPVVVKVQHPGIIEAINLDLSLFEKALPFARYIPETSVVDLRSVLREVKKSLDNETDFLLESHNAELFGKNNNHWRQIRVPKIYPTYCTKKVIVMELMAGDSLRKLMDQSDDQIAYGLVTVGALKKDVGRLLVESFMKQVFEDGFFHADPHPGNLLLRYLSPKENEQDGFNLKKKVGVLGGVDYSLKWQEISALPPYRLIYLDFGMMGHLNETLQARLSDTLIALYTQDTQQVAEAVLQLCKIEGPFDEQQFSDDLDGFLKRYYNLPIKEIDLQAVFAEMIAICRQNNLQLEEDITMLAKALSTLEGVVEELDPTISMMAITEPYAQKFFLERLDLKEEVKRQSLTLLQATRALPKLPVSLLQNLNLLATGKGQLNLKIKEQDKILTRLEAMVNKIVVALVLGATILGSSLLVTAGDRPPRFADNLGLIGYSIAVIVVIVFILNYLYHFFKRKK